MEAELKHGYNQSGKHVRNILPKRFKGEDFQGTCVHTYVYVNI